MRLYFGAGGPVAGEAPVLGHSPPTIKFETPENIDDLKRQVEAGREGTILTYEGAKNTRLPNADEPVRRPGCRPGLLAHAAAS